MSNATKMTSGYDANLPLTIDSVDMFYTLNKTLKENIKQSVKMLFLTSPGERIMVPEYGVGFRNFLFEQTPEEAIIERINAQVGTFLPNLTILSLTVNRGDILTESKSGQSNSLVVNFFYEINGTNIRDSARFADDLIAWLK